MALSELLLSVLVDPVDKQSLLWVPSENVLFNPRAKTFYRVVDDIPVMLASEASEANADDVERFTRDPAARLTGETA